MRDIFCTFDDRMCFVFIKILKTFLRRILYDFFCLPERPIYVPYCFLLRLWRSPSTGRPYRNVQTRKCLPHDPSIIPSLCPSTVKTFLLSYITPPPPSPSHPFYTRAWKHLVHGMLGYRTTISVRASRRAFSASEIGSKVSRAVSPGSKTGVGRSRRGCRRRTRACSSSPPERRPSGRRGLSSGSMPIRCAGYVFLPFTY